MSIIQYTLTERSTDSQVGTSRTSPCWASGTVHVPPLLRLYQFYNLCLGCGGQHRRQDPGYGQVCECTNFCDSGANADHQCTVTGGNIGLTAPVIILNVMNTAPYFGIVDMGVDKNLTFTGDCMSTVTTLPGTCDVSAGKSPTLL